MKSKVINLKNIRYPMEYKTNYIFAHAELNDELKDMITKSGYVDTFKKNYSKALRFLENLKLLCVNHNLFEKLKDADGLYSMRLIGEKNIRILFMFTRMDNRDIVILLTCFQEKNKEDYRAPIIIANERKNELTQGH